MSLQFAVNRDWIYVGINILHAGHFVKPRSGRRFLILVKKRARKKRNTEEGRTQRATEKNVFLGEKK